MYYCRLFCNLLYCLRRITRCCHKKRELIEANSSYANPNQRIESVITWNLQGLFLFMYERKRKNILYELGLVTQDVICLQEVFEDYLKEDIIHHMKHTHPYYLMGNTHKKYIVGDDSGLLVLSKYPIQFVKEIVLDEALMPDSLANKSILYFKVGNLNMVNTHLQSSNMNEAEGIAESQVELLVKQAPFTQFLICGDLNTNLGHYFANEPKNNFTPTWRQDILDYILVKQYPNIQVQPVVSSRSIQDVTDHYPLSSKLHYL